MNININKKGGSTEVTCCDGGSILTYIHDMSRDVVSFKVENKDHKNAEAIRNMCFKFVECLNKHANHDISLGMKGEHELYLDSFSSNPKKTTSDCVPLFQGLYGAYAEYYEKYVLPDKIKQGVLPDLNF